MTFSTAQVEIFLRRGESFLLFVWQSHIFLVTLWLIRDVAPTTKLTELLTLKNTRIMSKTVKTILQVISYIIAAILGAAGEATLM